MSRATILREVIQSYFACLALRSLEYNNSALAHTLTERNMTHREPKMSAQAPVTQRDSPDQQNMIDFLLANSQDGVLLINAAGRVQHANRTACQIFGRNLSELLHQQLDTLLIDSAGIADQPPASDLLARLIATQTHNAEQQPIELAARHQDGETIAVSLTLASIVGEQPDQYCLFIRDLSALTQLQNRLTESEKLFRHMFENTLVAAAIIDPQTGCIVDLNQATSQLYGYDRPQMCGMLVNNVLDDASRSIEQTFQAVLEGLHPYMRMRHRKKSGELFDVETYVSLITMKGQQLIHVLLHDVTARLLAEKELRIAASAFQSNEAILIADREFHILRVNHAFEKLTGFTQSEIFGRKPFFLAPANSPAKVVKSISATMARQPDWQGEVIITSKQGENLPIWLGFDSVLDDAQQPSHMVFHFIDLTVNKKQEDRIQRGIREEKLISALLRFSLAPGDAWANEALDLITDTLWLRLSRSGTILLNQPNSDGSSALIPYGTLNLDQQLLEEAIIAAMPLTTGACAGDAVANRHMNAASSSQLNIPLRFDDTLLGILVLFCISDTQLEEADHLLLNRITEVLCLGISRQQAQVRINYLAYHDPLTGLPNRALLYDRLEQMIRHDLRHHRYGALIFLDLDGFKNINDTLGHAVGDRLLIETANRLATHLRDEDTVARLGGDEFVLLLPDLGANRDEAISRVHSAALRVQAQISRGFVIDQDTLHFTVSTGIALFTPDEEQDVEQLMMQADTAMYHAKKSGGNAIQFFAPEMQQAARRRMELERDLRIALDEGQFELHYQSQWNQQSQMIGAEALLRWHHPEHGLISPVEFIPVAEESGLICAIGHWVLREACRNLQQLAGDANRAASFRHLSVNVSPREFRQPEFVSLVEAAIHDSAVDPAMLTLELTEGLLIENINDTIEKMAQLKGLGIRFSIDDFGTGYSSLAYLKQLQIDELKIDRSFVNAITEEHNDLVIVATIIAMGKGLGLDVIAEGVETQAQRELLQQHGCDAFQGYLLGRPASFEVLIGAMGSSTQRDKPLDGPISATG